MKTRMLLWTVLVLAAAFLLYGAESLLLQRQLAEKTLRLHVVANSDSTEDQAEKLLVRDAVLQCVSRLTADCKTAHEAQQVIAENLWAVKEAAESVGTVPVSVSLERELFDTRHYDTFSLPAGVYPSLRVRLGAGEGHNWWCVVFPSLCVPATSRQVQTAAQLGGYSTQEADLICGGEGEYELRFKTLEWLRKIRELLK